VDRLEIAAMIMQGLAAKSGVEAVTYTEDRERMAIKAIQCASELIEQNNRLERGDK